MPTRSRRPVAAATQTALFGPDAPFAATDLPVAPPTRSPAGRLADLPAGLNVPLPGMPVGRVPRQRRRARGMPAGIRLAPRPCLSCRRTLTDRRSIVRGRGSDCHAAYRRDARQHGWDPDVERQEYPRVCDAAVHEMYL